ncbi:glycine cleavage system protein GcvH [Streptomyces purpurogeneiscleroticus]|uniref:glycine cleavage system protein GcvH n=1 Tax=Streptomyces purpurogeneiscleroticus TaxID=68259 RepID=UPI001CBE3EE9|nr:glycine cleavage system protein GcvH [Streptomyces purpurogeneiscleroticus]MBZ4020034.1 glycine cleavage system protein H [Streptomyces purpurogeneiscleroticus]
MANFPEDLSYSKDHEWLRRDGDRATIGLTDHAQRQLGDIVYVELPKEGERFEADEPFGSVESVKAVSEVCLPVTGTVLSVNGSLDEEPEQINTDPYGAGWLLTIRLSGSTDALLTAAQYEEYVREGLSG